MKGDESVKVLSLFDGISCGRVALERAGHAVDEYHAYEIDEYAIQVSRRNYPDIVHHGDVTVADFTEYRGIDLLIGGRPCQSLSIVQSKTRENLSGKSKLFFEFVRAMEEAKPRWFLFENVESMNAESEAVISGLLGCDPVLIDSASFSAQSRPRLYWTNIPLGKVPESSPLVLRDIMQPANNVDSRYWYDYPLENVDMSKQVCAKMIHKNHEMHKRVFNPAFKCHTLTAAGGGNTQKKVMQDGRARKLTPLEYERLQTLVDNYTAGISDSRRYRVIGNCWTVDAIVWILLGLILE